MKKVYLSRLTTTYLCSFSLAFILVPTQSMASGAGKSKLDPSDPKIADKIANKDGVEMIAHQLLIKFESENAAAQRQKIFKSFGGIEVERVGSTPLFLVQFSEETNIHEVKTKLEHLEGIQYAEPNLVMRALPAKPKD